MSGKAKPEFTVPVHKDGPDPNSVTVSLRKSKDPELLEGIFAIATETGQTYAAITRMMIRFALDHYKGTK